MLLCCVVVFILPFLKYIRALNFIWLFLTNAAVPCISMTHATTIGNKRFNEYFNVTVFETFQGRHFL